MNSFLSLSLCPSWALMRCIGSFYYKLFRSFNPVFLPGKSYGWRILVGCSPWGCEELDMTEQFFTFNLSYFSCLCCILAMVFRYVFEFIKASVGSSSSVKCDQSCPTLCNPMTVLITLEIILEWVIISYSKEIFLTTGLNLHLLCLLLWQADSWPLCHLGSQLDLIFCLLLASSEFWVSLLYISKGST